MFQFDEMVEFEPEKFSQRVLVLLLVVFTFILAFPAYIVASRGLSWLMVIYIFVSFNLKLKIGIFILNKLNF